MIVSAKPTTTTKKSDGSDRIHTFSVLPCFAISDLISLCFSAEKMMKADLKRLGASGAFLYFGAEDEAFGMTCAFGIAR